MDHTCSLRMFFALCFLSYVSHSQLMVCWDFITQ